MPNNLRIKTRKQFAAFVALVTIILLLVSVAVGVMQHGSWGDILLAGLISVGTSLTSGVIGWLILTRLVLKRILPEAREVENKLGASIASQLKTDIDYEVDLCDLPAFRVCHRQHFLKLGSVHKVIRRLVMVTAFADAFGLFTLALVMGKNSLPFVLFLGILGALTISLYFLYPLLLLSGIARTLKRISISGGASRVIGKHRISITPGAISDATDASESTTSWKSVAWICSTQQYLFMGVIGSVPLIVPRIAFAGETEFKQLVDTVEAYHQAAITS